MEIKLAFTADIVPAKQAAIFSKVSGYIRRSTPIAATSWRPGRSWWRSTISSCRRPAIRPRPWSARARRALEMARSTLEGNRANLENQRANLAKARAVADNDARQAGA